MPATLTSRPRRLLIATFAASVFVLAACSDGGEDATAGSAAPEPTMASEAPMDDATMAEAFGDGCAAVPADGAGSFEGMAEDPVATAASNNPVLSTLVTAVGEATSSTR